MSTTEPETVPRSVYKAFCHALALRAEELVELRADNERLRAERQRVLKRIDLWLVLGTHRNCDCPACEDLRQVAIEAATVGEDK